MSSLTKIFVSACVFLAFILSSVTVARSIQRTAPNSKQTMVWLCLERCGETSADIHKNLDVIRAVAPRALTAVSFEMFDLKESSNIVQNPRFTDVYSQLRTMKGAFDKQLRLLPMITTVQIDYMRTVWLNPEPFIRQCIDIAKSNQFTGYNIDWEPEKGVLASDAPKYVDFLGKVVTAFDQHGLELNVDVASWTVLYNFTGISQAMSVGPVENRMITMDTYAGSQSGWEKAFNKAITSVTSIERLGIGLDTVNPNNGLPLTKEDLAWRFGYIQDHKIQEVDFWMMNSTIMGQSSYFWDVMEHYLDTKN